MTNNHRNYQGARAIVVGGSIGGLTTALLLRDLGFDVTIFERTPTVLDGRGSGIVLQPDTLRWFTERSTQNPARLSTSTRWVQYLDGADEIVHREERTWSYTAWGTFYRALLDDFGLQNYILGEFAAGYEQHEQSATVRFVSGRVETADLVVFADGITSMARSPDRPHRHDDLLRIRRLAWHGPRAHLVDPRHGTRWRIRSVTRWSRTRTSPCTRFRASTGPVRRTG